MQAVERSAQCSSSAGPWVSFALRSQIRRRHRLEKTCSRRRFSRSSRYVARVHSTPSCGNYNPHGSRQPCGVPMPEDLDLSAISWPGSKREARCPWPTMDLAAAESVSPAIPGKARILVWNPAIALIRSFPDSVVAPARSLRHRVFQESDRSLPRPAPIGADIRRTGNRLQANEGSGHRLGGGGSVVRCLSPTRPARDPDSRSCDSDRTDRSSADTARYRCRTDTVAGGADIAFDSRSSHPA